MPLSKEEWLALEKKACELRKLCLYTTYKAGSGHIGGGTSVMDILTVLYHKCMNFNPKDYNNEDRDRFVLSKGHVGIAMAPVLADLGLIPIKELDTFNLTNSKLGIHLDCNKVKGLDASTGSLGHGSALGLGMALAAKIKKKSYKTFVVLGDGECNEGSVWEAAMATVHYKANNLVTIVDRNFCMIDGRTEDVMNLEPFADKWKAFGFDTLVINGHNFKELYNAIEYAKNTTGKPVCIVCNTVKGEGIDFMEDDYVWHYGAIDENKFNQANDSLEKHYNKRVARVNKEG